MKKISIKTATILSLVFCVAFGLVGSAEAQNSKYKTFVSPGKVCDANNDGLPDQNFTDIKYELLNSPAAGGEYKVNDIIQTKVSFKATGSAILEEGENISVMLVMDRSGSMRGNKIIEAKEALKSVVNTIANENDSKNVVGLVSYNDSATLDAELTSSYQQVKSRIDQMMAVGGTSMGAGLVVGANEMDSHASASTRKYIVLASDGEHTQGTTADVGINRVSSDTTVYTVGIGNNADKETLEEIAKQAGTGSGEYYFANTNQIEDVFEDIIESILHPFRVENLSVTFNRDANSSAIFYEKNGFPSNFTHSSGSKVNDTQVKWEKLGNKIGNEYILVTDDRVDLYVNFLASQPGQNITLNASDLVLDYYSTQIKNGKNCTDIVALPILTVNIGGVCQGTPPANANICPSDGDDVPGAVNVSLVPTCTDSQKCEYTCDTTCYTYQGGTCQKNPQKPAICGGASNNNHCSLNSANGTLCKAGSVKSFQATSTGWEWQCEYNGDACYPASSHVVDCKAYELVDTPASCGSASSGGGSSCSVPTGSAACSIGTPINVRTEGGSWKWECKSTCGQSNSGTCSVDKYCGWTEVAP